MQNVKLFLCKVCTPHDSWCKSQTAWNSSTFRSRSFFAIASIHFWWRNPTKLGREGYPIPYWTWTAELRDIHPRSHLLNSNDIHPHTYLLKPHDGFIERLSALPSTSQWLKNPDFCFGIVTSQLVWRGFTSRSEVFFRLTNGTLSASSESEDKKSFLRFFPPTSSSLKSSRLALDKEYFDFFSCFSAWFLLNGTKLNDRFHHRLIVDIISFSKQEILVAWLFKSMLIAITLTRYKGNI